VKLNQLFQPLHYHPLPDESFFAVLQWCRRDEKRVASLLDSHNSSVRADGYAELCTTHYRAFKTGLQQLKSISWKRWSAPYYFFKWCLIWLPLIAWCVIRMRHLSTEMTLCIQNRMSAEHCDLLHLILRVRGKWSEALTCVELGLRKGAYTPTYGMLHLGRAEILCHQGKRKMAAHDVRHALEIATEAEVYDPEMSAAIYMRAADLMQFIDLRDYAKEHELRCRADTVMRNTQRVES